MGVDAGVCDFTHYTNVSHGFADVLSIRLHGGYYVDTEQHAGIYFVCDHDHDNVRVPYFLLLVQPALTYSNLSPA